MSAATMQYERASGVTGGEDGGMLPVAVVSAHALDGAPAGLPGGADHYLEKPLRVDQLIATATALIGRGRPRWAGPYPDTPGRDTLPT